MRLDVIIGTPEEFENAAAVPDCAIEGYPAYYTGLLQDAEEKKEACLDLRGIGKQARPSLDFQYMGVIEQAVVNFQRQHEFPEKVRILCRSEEELTSYMVVYNFWYAEQKSTRLNNGKWD